MKLVRRLALPLVLLLAAATSLRAQEAPVAVARASIASIDAVNKLITDLGIPGLPDIRQGLESAPFMTAGALDTTKPLGVIIMASNNQPLLSPNSLIVAFPMSDGKGTVADITAKGLKPVEGQADVLTGNNSTVRRTAGYLMAKPGENSPLGLSVVTDDAFTSDYKTAGNLAVLSLNFAMLRDKAPNAYKQLLAAPALAGIPMGEGNPFQASLDKLDRFTFALATDDKNIHLKTWTTPYPTKAAKNAPRPIFPAGTIFQMHLIYPDAETAMSVDRAFDGIPDTTLNLPPGIAKRVKDVLKRIGKINSGADAVSIAFNMKDKNGVLYVVSQMNADYDFPAEAKAVTDEIMAITKDVSPNEKLTADISSYDASGKKATRLVVSGNNPSEKIFLDVIQDGKTLFLTGAIDDGKYVEELAGTKMGAPSNLLCAGALDLTALLKAISEGGAPIPPNMVQELKTAFANQGITWTVQIAETGNYMYCDVQIPTVVVKQLIKTGMDASRGGGGPPPTP